MWKRLPRGGDARAGSWQTKEVAEVTAHAKVQRPGRTGRCRLCMLLEHRVGRGKQESKRMRGRDRLRQRWYLSCSVDARIALESAEGTSVAPGLEGPPDQEAWF